MQRPLLTGTEIRHNLAIIAKARDAGQSVSVGRMKGRLVVKVTPQWNLLQRFINWVRGYRVTAIFKQELMEALRFKETGPELKRSVFNAITSGVVPGFSLAERQTILAEEKNYFRQAKVSPVVDVDSQLSPAKPSNDISQTSAQNPIEKSTVMVKVSPLTPPPVTLAPDSRAFLISDDQHKLAVIESFRRRRSVGEVNVIRRPSDFDNDSLVRTLVCDANGTLRSSAGRLFTDTPVTLVIDFTVMSPAQIASLNELFDQPPRYQGRPLGANVTIAALVTAEMQNQKAEHPGPDFWRRMDSLGLSSIPEQSGLQSDRALLAQITKDHSKTTPLDEQEQWFAVPESPAGQLSLDFSQHSEHWRTLLFGGLQLSGSGRLQFRPGLLANLSEDTVTVELVNTPTDDPEFTAALATAIRNRGFRANGQWQTLPAELTLELRTTSHNELNQQLAQLRPAQPSQPYINLNEDNFDAVMADVTLDHNQLVQGDTLRRLTDDGAAVRVTGQLSSGQWMRLISRLHGMKPAPALSVAPESRVLNGLTLKPFIAPVKPTTDVHLTTPAGPQNPEPRDAFVYQITPRTSPHTLLVKTVLTSQQRMTFAEQHTPLMEALLAGRPITLKGLDSNPDVARQLESLLAPVPYMLSGGRKITLPPVDLHCELTTARPLPGLWAALPKPKAEPPAQPTSLWLQHVGLDKDIPLEQLQQLATLLARLNTIPPSRTQLYPATSQHLSETLVRRIVVQVHRETSSDQARQPEAYHWRKALNDVIAKEYRGQPAVYGFVKSQINGCFPTPGARRVDGTALENWLQQHPNMSRDQLQEHYWELARHIDPALLAPVEHYGVLPATAITTLLPILVHSVPEPQQPGLADRWYCRSQPPTKIKMVNGNHYRRIYNALLAASPKGRLPVQLPIHKQALAFAEKVQSLPQPLTRETVTPLLAKLFTPKLLAGDFHDLTDALVSGKASHYRQQRRIKRLAEKLAATPMVMLKGEAGTGKSHTAYAVACQQSGDREPLVLSLSPEHTQEELFGQDLLTPATVTIRKDQLPEKMQADGSWSVLCTVAGVPDSGQPISLCFDQATRRQLFQRLPEGHVFELVDNFADSQSRFQPGPLLEWARMANPPVLILDEANLVPVGTLHPLLGLFNNPPTLSYNGETIVLTSRHRVILTGNPESYDGRINDPELRQQVLNLYYRPMDQGTLAESIVKPGLPELWPDGLKQYGTATVMDLYRQYQRLLPQHTFGPRDLKDILARITTDAAGRVPDQNSLNTLIWQAMAETLAGEIKGQPQQQRALWHWYNGQHPCDLSLKTDQQKTFSDFYQRLKTSCAGDGFDFAIPSVEQLAGQVFRDLQKQGGKHAMIIEGEAGRGKDALLDRLLPVWLASQNRTPEFDRINASPNNWDEIKGLALKAMRNGTVLVISELNTLPSRYLEGLFNDVLNGQAAQGFKLIATINPATYSGREPMSEAMQSRCTRIVIPGFSRQELKQLMHRRYPGKARFTDWLVNRHCDLAESLEQSQSSIRLPLAKLLSAAKSLHQLPEEKWNLGFDQAYQLALMGCAKVKVSARTTVENQARQQREQQLCQLLNQDSDQPISVTLTAPGSGASFDNQQLVLPDGGDITTLVEQAAQVIGAGTDRVKVIRERLGTQLRRQEQQRQEQRQAELRKREAEAAAHRAKEQELRARRAETQRQQQSQPVPKKPSGFMANLYSKMDISSLTGLIAKFSAAKAVGIIQLLPTDKLLKLISKLPLDTLISLMATMVKVLPTETIAAMIERIDVNALEKTFASVDLADFQKMAAQVTPDKLEKMTAQLPLDELAAITRQLPEEKMKAFLNQLEPGARKSELEQRLNIGTQEQPAPPKAKVLSNKELAKLAATLPLEQLSEPFAKTTLEQLYAMPDNLPAERLKRITAHLSLEQLQIFAQTLSPKRCQRFVEQFAPGLYRQELERLIPEPEPEPSETVIEDDDLPELPVATPTEKRAEPLPQANDRNSSGWRGILSGWQPEAPYVLADFLQELPGATPQQILAKLARLSNREKMEAATRLTPEQLIYVVEHGQEFTYNRLFWGKQPDFFLNLVNNVPMAAWLTMVKWANPLEIQVLWQQMPWKTFTTLVKKLSVPDLEFFYEKLPSGTDRERFICQVHRQRCLVNSNATGTARSGQTIDSKVIPRSRAAFAPDSYSPEHPAICYYPHMGDTPLAAFLLGSLLSTSHFCFGENWLSRSDFQGWLSKLEQQLAANGAPASSAHIAELMAFFRALIESEARRRSAQLPKGNQPSKAYTLKMPALLAGLRRLHQQHILPTENWHTMLGEAVFGAAGMAPEFVIDLLEDLENHPVYGQQAARAISDYYQRRVTAPRQLPKTLPPSPPSVSLDKNIKIPLLERALSNKSIDTEWSSTMTSSGPDINRLARRAPAFKVKTTNSTLPTVVTNIHHGDIQELIAAELNRKSRIRAWQESGSVEFSINILVQAIAEQFTRALEPYRNKANWQVVCALPQMFRSDCTVRMREGIYGYNAITHLLGGRTRALAHYQVAALRDPKTVANTRRVIGALATEPTLILDRSNLSQCLADFINQLSYQELYRMAHPRIARALKG